jgi:hypothetical protein
MLSSLEGVERKAILGEHIGQVTCFYVPVGNVYTISVEVSMRFGHWPPTFTLCNRTCTVPDRTLCTLLDILATIDVKMSRSH